MASEALETPFVVRKSNNGDCIFVIAKYAGGFP
jgi:hypothetical protein